jgi:hypothetical protein
MIKKVVLISLLIIIFIFSYIGMSTLQYNKKCFSNRAVRLYNSLENTPLDKSKYEATLVKFEHTDHLEYQIFFNSTSQRLSDMINRNLLILNGDYAIEIKLYSNKKIIAVYYFNPFTKQCIGIWFKGNV